MLDYCNFTQGDQEVLYCRRGFERGPPREPGIWNHSQKGPLGCWVCLPPHPMQPHPLPSHPDPAHCSLQSLDTLDAVQSKAATICKELQERLVPYNFGSANHKREGGDRRGGGRGRRGWEGESEKTGEWRRGGGGGLKGGFKYANTSLHYTVILCSPPLFDYGGQRKYFAGWYSEWNS